MVEASGRPRSRVARIGSSLLALGFGVLLGWKDVASIQSGVFTRGGWRHDIMRSDEPVWFWVNVSGVGLCALLCIVAGISIIVSVIRNRGSADASFSIHR